MKKLLLLFILVLVFAACDNTTKDTDNQVIVEGYFTKSQNEMIYLMELNAHSLEVVDSTVIGADGRLKFEFIPSESPEFYVLQSRHFNQAITLLVKSGEKIEVEGDLPTLNENYHIRNSEGSERVHKLTQIINLRMAKVDKYYTEYRDNPDSMSMNQLRSKVDSLLRINQVGVYEEVRNYITEEPASLSAILALYSKFGRNTILEYKYDSDLFQLVSDSLIRKYPNNSHSIKLHQKILEFKNADELKKEREDALEVGKKFPEIILKDIDNQPKDLSQCISKVCVVLVWESKSKASWDVNEILKKLYKKYQSQGLSIYAISFDTDKLAWTNYCHMNHWDWTNVIGFPREKKMLNAEEKMPRLFLLDSDRKIIVKDPLVEDLEEIIFNNLKKQSSK